MATLTAVDTALEGAFPAAGRRVHDSLYAPQHLEPAVARGVIAHYTAAIADNFIPWLQDAAQCARSQEGREAAERNLLAELRENHPKMLYDFAEAAGAMPNSDHYNNVAGAVDRMYMLTGRGRGLENLAVIATLETASRFFIPYLAELARSLGSTEFTYTNKHGEADKAHAAMFVAAMREEMKFHHRDPEQRIGDTIKATEDFLRKILR